jgi:hypothetical protein
MGGLTELAGHVTAELNGAAGSSHPEGPHRQDKDSWKWAGCGWCGGPTVSSSPRCLPFFCSTILNKWLPFLPTPNGAPPAKRWAEEGHQSHLSGPASFLGILPSSPPVHWSAPKGPKNLGNGTLAGHLATPTKTRLC